MSTEIPYHFALSLPVYKKISWMSDFVPFFMCFFFSHAYSPRQVQTTLWGQIFYDNRKAYSLCPYVASFKMTSSKSDFIHIFNDFIHVYSPGARAESPYHFDHLLQVSNKSLNSDFVHIFNVFPHVYSPGAGADNPLWTKF